MNGAAEPGQAEDREQQAVAWLVRVQSDAATGDDWAALTVWLESSEENLAAFETAEAALHMVDLSAAEIRAALMSDVHAPAGRTAASRAPQRGRAGPAPHRRRMVIGAAALAASVAGLLVLVPARTWLGQGASTPYKTGVGQTRTVALEDGSKIQLDAASNLSVRFDSGSRNVEMGSAQATFDVTKDPRRPFIIQAGGRVVRVVGTEFNIRNYDRRLVVTVRRGVVAVSSASDPSQPPELLRKGEALTLEAGATRGSRSNVDPDRAFAWTSGRLVCDDEPLPEIVADLNRRYVRQIRLSPSALRRRFTGVLVLNDQAETVRHLAAYLSLNVQSSDKETVLN